MEYTNWGGGQPDNHGGKDECTDDCKEKCVILYGNDDLKWHDASCENYRYICQYTNMAESCKKEIIKSSCLDGIFYNISDSKANIKEAFMTCAEDGGSLLMVPSEEVQKFIQELINKNEPTKLDPVVKFFFQGDGFWKFFLQTHLPHLQLIIIVGLCMDGGKSIASRFLRTKMMQFLGRISLSLYLLHWPLMGFVLLAFNGPQNFGTSAEIWAAYFSGKINVPFGAPAIHIIISPIVCFIATKYFEEPIAKILRGTK